MEGKLCREAQSWAARGRAPAAISSVVPWGGRERGSGPSALAHEALREAASGAVKGGCEMSPGQGDALLQCDLPCTACVQARKTDFARKHKKKKRRCSCVLESLTCPAAVVSALLSLRDRVSLLCSTVAQHPSSELIRSMHF